MNKGELIESIAEKTGLSKAKAGEYLETVLETVQHTLKKGGDVALTGFGTFKTVKKAARTGRNPKTGTKIQVEPKKLPFFKVGKELKVRVDKKK